MFIIQDTVTKEYIAGRSHRRVQDIGDARVFSRKIDAVNALYGDRNKVNLEVIEVVTTPVNDMGFVLRLASLGAEVADRLGIDEKQLASMMEVRFKGRLISGLSAA